MTAVRCRYPACDRDAVTWWKGPWCGLHSRQHVGDLPTIQERFWGKVDRRGNDECWMWLAGTVRGYGWFHVRMGERTYAHRYAYEVTHGPIAEGLTLDHLCRTPLCVNPAHLEPVTQGENVRRGIAPPAENARKTHCLHGHPFDEANTYYPQPTNRQCRKCRADRQRERARRLVMESRGMDNRGAGAAGDSTPYPDEPAAPITESELFDILETDYWHEVEA